jgi:hypothetical protein
MGMPDEPGIVALIAALGGLVTERPGQHTQVHAPCENPPRCVVEPKGVQSRQPKIECDIATKDPHIANNQRAVLLKKFFFRRAALPIAHNMEVEMDDRKPG